MSHSTITPTTAAETGWDVAVVGAGPAGSVCAATCAAAGARTILIDRARFPREKVCGCCLSGRGVAAVESILGAGALASLGARPLREVTIRAEKRAASFHLDGGVAISRSAFDAALVAHAADAGAAVLLGTSVRLAPNADTGERRLALSEGGAVDARIVVGADGLGGRLLDREPGMAWRVGRRAHMGAGCTLSAERHPCTDGQVLMCCSRDGYVGLTRLECGSLDVACALDRVAAQRAGGPASLASQILERSQVSTPAGLDRARWRGAPALTRRRRAAGERVLAIGDAAGYVEPFTGEGMSWAIEGALLAAPLAVAGSRAWSNAIGDSWVRLHARCIRRRQRACRLVAATLRRPAALELAIGALNAAPAAGDAIAAMLHGRRAPA